MKATGLTDPVVRRDRDQRSRRQHLRSPPSESRSARAFQHDPVPRRAGCPRQKRRVRSRNRRISVYRNRCPVRRLCDPSSETELGPLPAWRKQSQQLRLAFKESDSPPKGDATQTVRKPRRTRPPRPLPGSRSPASGRMLCVGPRPRSPYCEVTEPEGPLVLVSVTVTATMSAGVPETVKGMVNWNWLPNVFDDAV